MATIVKRGKNYYVVFRYDDANGNSQQKWESFKTKKEAQKRKSEVKHEIDTGTFIPPASIKIKDFLVDFVDMYGIRKWGLSMCTSNTGLIRNYINPVLGEVNVQDVDARVVDKFIATLQKTKAVDCNGRRAKTEFVTPCTIEKICKLMRCAFGQAIRWGMVGRNPFIGATLPKREQKKRAIGDAETIRSALDACEIMNVGVNYMREHVESTTRIHYSYLAAGEKPNIVPDYAALHYFLRTKDLKSNFELLERIKKCAQGAALMTETEFKVTIISHGPGCIQINGFNRFLYEAATKVPPLTYDEEEMAFATELFKNVNGREPAPGESPVFTNILAPSGHPVHAPSSTDAGHVSRLAPTSRLYGWGMIKGVPSHSWGYVATAGHSIGLKSAIYAGMAQAQCCYEIMKDPSVIEPWRADWMEQVASEINLKPLMPGELK